MKGYKLKCPAVELDGTFQHISGDQREVFHPLHDKYGNYSDCFKPNTKYRCPNCKHSVGIYARFMSDGSFHYWMVKTHYYIRKSI